MTDTVGKLDVPQKRALLRTWTGQVLRPAAFLVLPLAALCILVSLVGASRLESIMTEALIYVVMVVGLSIFIGNSGMVSFGHVTFALIAAYASAWQTCCGPMKGIFMPELPAWLLALQVPVLGAAVIASALAALVALLLGTMLMRLSGTAASIALLSMLFVFKTIYENWQGWTAGQSAVVGLPTYVSLWTAFAAVLLAIMIATIYRISSFGLRLRAVREDEAAARASGVNAWAQKLIAFTVSGFVSGLGGVLYGHFLGTISVSMFWLDMTFLTLAMLVVGGLRSLTGAVVGTMTVVVLRESIQVFERGISVGGDLLKAPEGTREILLALLLLLVLIFRPEGIVGEREAGEKR